MKKVRILLYFYLLAILALPLAAQGIKKHPGLHPFRDKTGQWGFIDGTGRFRIAPKYAGAEEFSDGVAYVFFWQGQERKNGIVDTSGRFTALETNDYPVSFHEGLARFQSPSNPEREYGYLDKSGRVIIEPQFSYAGDFSEGRAWIGVLKDSKWVYGFIDTTGRIAVPPQFSLEPSDFSEGLARVMGTYGWGFIDRDGKFAIPPEFELLDRAFTNGVVAAVSRSEPSRGVYLDHSGQVAFEIPLWQQRTARQKALQSWRIEGRFSEGLAPVLSFNKFGFINRAGKVVIEPLFRDTKGFSEGLAAVRIIGSNGGYVWGYIDPTGKFAIEARFKTAQPFAGGLAHVETLDGNAQLIDHRGAPVKLQNRER